MNRERIRKIVLAVGGTGLGLFLAVLLGLYFYGTAVSSEEITQDTLEGRWATRIVERHDRLAVQLYARFDQPVDVVWQFVRNYEEYPERLDYVVSAEVIKQNADEFTLKLVTKSFPTNVSEKLNMRYETGGAVKRATWSQIEGNLAHNDGEWEVTPTPNGCFLKYTLCVSYGGPVPDWLLHALLRLYAPEIVEAIDRVVER